MGLKVCTTRLLLLLVCLLVCLLVSHGLEVPHACAKTLYRLNDPSTPCLSNFLFRWWCTIFILQTVFCWIMLYMIVYALYLLWRQILPYGHGGLAVHYVMHSGLKLEVVLSHPNVWLISITSYFLLISHWCLNWLISNIDGKNSKQR